VKALTKSHVVLALNQQLKVSSNEFLVSWFIVTIMLYPKINIQ
jgi:hypothetical protein